MSYNEACRYLYGKHFPTTHHINFISNDRVIKSFNIIEFEKVHVTFELVFGCVNQEYSHMIVNFTDTILSHQSKSASEIVRFSGPSITRYCKSYIEKNGPLAIGEVIMSSGGELHCHFILHSIFYEANKSLVSTDVLSLIFQKVMTLTDSESCKSLSIPVAELEQNLIIFLLNQIVQTLCATLKTSDKIIVRLFCEDHSILKNWEINLKRFIEQK